MLDIVLWAVATPCIIASLGLSLCLMVGVGKGII